MDFFLGEGATELFDPKFRQHVLLDIVGCTGLSAAFPRKNKHRHHGHLDDENTTKTSLHSFDDGTVTTNGGGGSHDEVLSDHEEDHHSDDREQSEEHSQKQNDNFLYAMSSRAESFSTDNGQGSPRRRANKKDDDNDEDTKKKKNKKPTLDTHCVVKLAKLTVHRTKQCMNSTNPIWTIDSKSLCIIDIPNEQAMVHHVEGSPQSKLARSETQKHFDSGVVIEVRTGRRILGHAALSFEQIWDVCAERPGERLDIEVTLRRRHHNSSWDSDPPKPPLLAIRMRYATIEDEVFLGLRSPPEEESAVVKSAPAARAAQKNREMHLEASDLEFKEVRGLGIFKTRKKKINGEKHYRVMPGPDPYRPVEATEWMTKDQIHRECLKPSYNYVNVGTTGKVGKCYVEILKCKDLPNLDVDYMGVGDRTDPFVALMFEDCLVRTDMLWDELSPEWMPWTMRAFCFHMRHPSSLLMVGAFDYDGGLDDHDGIGRVVINLGNFQPNTSYLLHYDLHDDPHMPPEESKRGQITIRLRIEYPDEIEAVRMAFQPPPKCIINCKTSKIYSVLKYLKTGPVDLDHGSMQSIKFYMAELASYWTRICHFLDIMFEVFLWRGRLKVSKNRSIWFPHHSVVHMVTGIMCVEHPHLIGPTLLFGFAWMLLTIDYHNARHPDPWKRAKGVISTNATLLLGHSAAKEVHITPHEGVEEGRKRDKWDKSRGERMSLLISEVLNFFGEMGKTKNASKVESTFFVTNKAIPSWSGMVLGKALEAPTTILKNICKNARMFLRFINWDGYLANSVVLRCCGLALLWMVLPVNLIIWWVARVLAWTLLGPWMKLVDIFLVHPWYRTSDELLDLIEAGVEDIEPDLPNLERLLHSEAMAESTFKSRLVMEHAFKYKAMRDYIFGKYSEFVPFLDDSRWSSTPRSESTAEPYHENPPKKKSVRFSFSDGDGEEEQDTPSKPVAAPADSEDDLSSFVQSQKLKGNMIMEPYCRSDNENAPNVMNEGNDGESIAKEVVKSSKPTEIGGTEEHTSEQERKHNERKKFSFSKRDYSNREGAPCTLHYRKGDDNLNSMTRHIKLD